MKYEFSLSPNENYKRWREAMTFIRDGGTTPHLDDPLVQKIRTLTIKLKVQVTKMLKNVWKLFQ